MPDGFSTTTSSRPSPCSGRRARRASCRARRVFGDGRTRATWGKGGRARGRGDRRRPADRDVGPVRAAAFSRRGRSSSTCSTRSAAPTSWSAGRERPSPWRDLVAARRRRDELTARRRCRGVTDWPSYRRLVDAPRGSSRETRRSCSLAGSACSMSRSWPRLRQRPPRRSHGRGRGCDVARRTRERALAPPSASRPSSESGEELRGPHCFVCAKWGAISTDSLHPSTRKPGALESVEERLQAIADLKRRFAAASTASCSPAPRRPTGSSRRPARGEIPSRPRARASSEAKLSSRR